MKKLLLSVLIPTVLLLLSSCGEEPVNLNCDGGRMSITVNLETLPLRTGTKTILDGSRVLWGTDEYAMLYVNDGQDNFFKSKFSSADSGNGKTSASFDFDVTVAPAESYTLGGVYPYSAVTCDAGRDCQVTLPAVQNASADAYDPSAYIMVIRSETLKGMPEVWNSSLQLVASLNVLTLSGIKEKVTSVEIAAPGKSIAGTRTLDLAGDVNASVSGGQSIITVNYASPLEGDNASVLFASWGCDFGAGDKLTVTAYGESKVYSTEVEAGSAGALFKEGALCSINVDFSSVSGRPYNMKDFARAYAGVLDVWQSNWAVDGENGVGVFTGHFIPEDLAVMVGGKSYGRGQLAYLAAIGLAGLVDGTLTLSSPIPSAEPYKWGNFPYDETRTNGGAFQNIAVGLDFVRNVNDRNLSSARNTKTWPNLMSYFNDTDQGEPSVKGKYLGCCCAERSFLITARFYKYLLDNNIDSDIVTACAGMSIPAGLYEIDYIHPDQDEVTFSYQEETSTITVSSLEKWTATAGDSWITVSPASGNESPSGATVEIKVEENTSAAERVGKVVFNGANGSATVAVRQIGYTSRTIAAFGSLFASTVLDAWESNVGELTPYSGAGKRSGHIVPDDISFTFEGVEYNKAHMYETALRSFLLLYRDGKTTGFLPADFDESYQYASSPYYETDEFAHDAVKIDFINNFCLRAENYPAGSGNGKWPNYFTYPSSTAPVMTSYKGNCCLERSLLILARFYKYITDNNITSNISSACEGVAFGAGLYDQTVVSVNTNNVDVDENGGSAVVRLTAVDEWTASSDASWLTVEPASGTPVIAAKIKVQATKNDSRAPRTAKVSFSCGDEKAEVTVFQDDPSVEKIRKDVPNKAFYKDLFMDSGCNLSSYRTMPVVDYLGLDYEYFYTESESGASSSEIALQTKAFCGTETDLNGVFLYPDGEPRFRIIYVNGGQAANHGSSLGAAGRDNFRKFVANGGCYIGSCAGAFLATTGLTDEGKPRSNYLGLWPGYADNISLVKYDVIYEIPDDSPILDYYDFGGDYRILDMKHYNGPYFSQWDSVEGTEVLAYNNAPGCKLDTYPAIIAYKADAYTGRVIPSGGHPEQFKDGERRDLMASLVRYAFDGQGVAKVKATLVNGEVRTMDKSTSDNMPEYTMIGDKQCHHFVFSIPEGARNVKIRLESLKDCNLSLFLAKGTFAFREDAQYKVENSSSVKELSFDTMPQNGLWYIGVQSEETVTHSDSFNGYSYSGKTWLLNGAPYKISVSWE